MTDPELIQALAEGPHTSAALHGEDLRERVPAAENMFLPSFVTALEGSACRRPRG